MSRAYKTERKKHKVPVILKILIFLLVVIFAVALTVGINIYINRDFSVTFYQIYSDKVSDNIRIIELADLHNREYGENNCELISRVRSLHPDLIVYAGDMMNYQDDDYSVLFDLSDQLSEIAPVYACYGNNELDQYLFRDKTFAEQMKEHHIGLLSNESADISVRNTAIQLIGVSDDIHQFDKETNNSKKFVESLDPTANLRICLTHYPELFNEKLLNKGIDVAFTGHAHGGLIRLPRIGGIYSTGEGFLPKLTSGVVTFKDGTQVVISRGLGDSGSIPRINNQPELVVVDICWY